MDVPKGTLRQDAESFRGRSEFADDSETASSSARSRGSPGGVRAAWAVPVGTRRPQAFLPGAKEPGYLAGQVVNAVSSPSAK